MDVGTGKPIGGATVALADGAGKVVGWTTTNADGDYAIAADPLKILQLDLPHKRSLIGSVAHTVGTVVKAPVKIAESTVKAVNPVDTAKSFAASAVLGNPIPATAQVVGGVVNAATGGTETKTRQFEAGLIAGKPAGPAKPKVAAPPPPPEIHILVSAPNYKDVNGPADAYWLAAPATQGGQPVGPQAWLDTVQLAPADSKAASTVEHLAITLTDPTVSPAMATPGQQVTVSAKLICPPNPHADVRVFAQVEGSHQTIELTPAGKGDFSGTLILSPKTPNGQIAIAIAALHADPVGVDIRKGRGDALMHFAQSLDELDPVKPYGFDPRIMASENRLTPQIIVLSPKLVTPPLLPVQAPAPPPAPAQPAKQP